MKDKRENRRLFINELANILPNEPILVIDASWQPLDVTYRHRHAKKLLDTGKARLLNQAPYIIQLKYAIESPVKPHYAFSIDPGRTNFGGSLLDMRTSEVIAKFKCETRNKEVTKNMQERKTHRQVSRHGERQRRLRRSHKCNQENKQIVRDNGRMMHHNDVEYVIPVKGIKNQESKFNNRKRKAGWLTPTATHLKRSIKNLIKRVNKFVPISDVCLELNKFAFMQLEDVRICGVDYQNGRLRGFDSVKDYVNNMQEGICAMPGCQRKIEHYHHVTPRHKGGSDRPDNIVGLCKHCHEELHLGHLSLPDKGEFKRFAGTSVLNQVMPSLCRELVDEWGEHIHFCSGYETKLMREVFGISKDHDLDAVAIAAACLGLEPTNIMSSYGYQMHQYRRQDRSIVRAQYERTYKLDGKTIAKNRKPRAEQPKDTPALSELNLTETEISRLQVRKSYRSYNNLKRVLPGALFMVSDRLCVLTGQQCNGNYLLFKFDVVDDLGKPVRVKTSDAALVCCNKGWVFTGRY